MRKITHTIEVSILIMLSMLTHRSFGESLHAQMLNLENKAWSNLIGPSMNLEEFERSLAPDFLYVEATGRVFDAKEDLEVLKACSFESFKIVSLQAVRISPNAAIAIFKMNLDAECGGRPIPHDHTVSDVWVRRGHKWVVQLHTEASITEAVISPCDGTSDEPPSRDCLGP